MTSRRYKKLKKEIKQKNRKIKDYEISDNKLAALVFIVSIVLGIRAGNYLRLFVFTNMETKKKKKRKRTRIFESILRTRTARLGSRTIKDDESKGDDDPLACVNDESLLVK